MTSYKTIVIPSLTFEYVDNRLESIGAGGNVYVRKRSMHTGSLVYCRDCTYYVEDPDPIDPGWPMMCDYTGRDMVEPYGYCAWGERRESQ